MKTKISFIAALTIFFCNSFCYAQQKRLSPAQELKIHQASLKNTAYIFEGTITKQSQYHAKTGALLMCSVIKITKVYKGSPNIKLGTIKVITYGGKVNDGAPGLVNGTKYIILGRQANSNIDDSLVTADNTVVLTTMDCDYPIVFLGNGIEQWKGTQFKTLDSLYSFFKENGLTAQEE
jgi:hypothetical protein